MRHIDLIENRGEHGAVREIDGHGNVLCIKWDTRRVCGRILSRPSGCYSSDKKKGVPLRGISLGISLSTEWSRLQLFQLCRFRHFM